MSAVSHAPPTTEITLVYGDGRWTARDVESGTTETGETRTEALDALDAVMERWDGGSGSIDPDDPFWTAEPVAVEGPSDRSTRVDESLYGPIDE